jgi:hypothetical protein
VAVAFGAMGLGVNLLDLRLGDSGALRVSILAGLVFPLTVALAWGWRYGLISALAGGGQAMWWLWRGDGWGVVYAVPVFTLWIVWHGWWADRRRGHDDGRSWLRSCFLVELPFRAVVELGFYVVFPWLVWLIPRRGIRGLSATTCRSPGSTRWRSSTPSRAICCSWPPMSR